MMHMMPKPDRVFRAANAKKATNTRRDALAQSILLAWCANPKVVANPVTSPGAALDLADAMLTAERRRT